MGYEVATLNNVSLYITSITPTKTQKTIKQQLGKSVAEIRIVGMNTQQWELTVSGHILGTTSALLDTNRTNLETLDSATPAWVDGLHNGTYIMQPGSLKFDDSGDKTHSYYTYNFSLVQQ